MSNVKKNVCDNFMVLVPELKKSFMNFIKFDKKYCKKITVYYEIMTKENCIKNNKPFGNTFNAMDGFDLYNKQKKLREKNGYVYGAPTVVILGGEKMKRIIIKSNTEVFDFFGLISGYVQATNEIVCYYKSY